MKVVYQSLSALCPFLAGSYLGIMVLLLPDESQAFGEICDAELEPP